MTNDIVQEKTNLESTAKTENQSIPLPHNVKG